MILDSEGEEKIRELKTKLRKKKEDREEVSKEEKKALKLKGFMNGDYTIRDERPRELQTPSPRLDWQLT